MPVSTNSSCRRESLPTSSASSSRSSVTICEVFATESLGKPVVLAGNRTLPGASAHTRLLVNVTHTTVRMRLRLSASPWTTMTGLRNPGPEPAGSGRSAQYTWPWAITIRRLQGYAVRRRQAHRPGAWQRYRKHGSSLRSRPQDHGERRIQSQPRCKSGCATSLVAVTIAQRRQKPCRESRSQFSYQKYNREFAPAQGESMNGIACVPNVPRFQSFQTFKPFKSFGKEERETTGPDEARPLNKKM